jgi:chromosome segregation ATPase
MIHDDVVIVPSSRVNFVLGPNGSGKSSIVCALCLGLGGEPKDMRRGTTIGAFVKKGRTEGRIEVRLLRPLLSLSQREAHIPSFSPRCS